MPGIFPRLKDILFSGFGPVTELIAIICFMVGLLPKNHPCFLKERKSQYGLTRILAAAADNFEFKWQHLDRIIIFGIIVCGTVMMWLYLIGLIILFLTSPSMALGFGRMFETFNPENDIAFMMLDKVLGLPGVFNSSVSLTVPFPNPFQSGLHELFRFYSMGIFFIALVIFLYHVVHFVLEVTQTGKVSDHLSDETDAGHGFTWLPIRFILCFGLLLPFGEGLNSAQWITIYTAKYGSGLATNAWIQYNADTGDNPLGEDNVHLVTRPTPLDNTGLMKALFMMRACQVINYWALAESKGHDVRGYVVNGSLSKPLQNAPTGAPGFFNSYLDGGDTYNATPAAIANGDANDDFIQILKYSGFGDIRIVLGTFDDDQPEKYAQYPGKVLPVCGEVTIPVTSLVGEGLFASEGYLFAVLNILFDTNRPDVGRTDQERAFPKALMREYTRTSALVKNWAVRGWGSFDDVPPVVLENTICGDPAILGDCKKPVLASYWKEMMKDYFGIAFSSPTFSAYDFLANTDIASEEDAGGYYIFDTPTSFSALGKENPLLITTGILKYGWGGAGVWYNKLAERNGTLFVAVTNVPSVSKFPLVMENIKTMRLKTDTKVDGPFCEKFNPRKSGSTSSYIGDSQDQFSAEQTQALYNLCEQLFENEGLAVEGVTRTTKSTNPIEQAIQKFFSQFQMFDKEKNREVTPMAQLTSIGRALIDKAILGVTISAASYAAGGVAHMAAGADKQAAAMGDAAGVIGDFTMVIALIGLSSGFVLYYMLPMLPFIYFFFAVGRWVKVIFEALVGVPLWALAHMRVGGPGLPGNAAIGGYFLLLEIFIRPILTVFSLVGAFAIFSGLAGGLNTVFGLISFNLFGSAAPTAVGMTDMAVQYTRGMLDQFFLSVFYIALVYTIGTGSFKLIDLIPDNIMRWSGAGVQSFGASDVSDDMIEQWQWELPQRFNSATSTIDDAMKEVLYNPGKAASDKAQKEAKAAAEAEAKSKAEAQAKNNKDNQ